MLCMDITDEMARDETPRMELLLCCTTTPAPSQPSFASDARKTWEGHNVRTARQLFRYSWLILWSVVTQEGPYFCYGVLHCSRATMRVERLRGGPIGWVGSAERGGHEKAVPA